jgi:hypothetical protein
VQYEKRPVSCKEPLRKTLLTAGEASAKMKTSSIRVRVLAMAVPGRSQPAGTLEASMMEFDALQYRYPSRRTVVYARRGMVATGDRKSVV